jgi:NTP pyrophosphatase (non-canonical NTP hydrolase)
MDALESLKELRRHSIPKLLFMERCKQDVKWGQQDHNNERWLAILVEEVGEAATAIVEASPASEGKYTEIACMENLEVELIQVAAVCIQWIECLRRNNPV